MNGSAGENGLVFAAGLCSEGSGEDEVEVRRYAINLLYEFFRHKGGELKVPDYRQMLKRIFLHINGHLASEWSGLENGLDLEVVIATTSVVYAARSGQGGLFLFHEGEAQALLREKADDAVLLGKGSGEAIEVIEMPISPGDIAVLCNPAVARVLGARDVTLILRRASDPPKASLFLSAIAERKGAEGPLTALIWEVPNYQGAAILTGETPPAGQPETEAATQAEADKEEPADQAKKQWLSKWRRRKE